MHNYLVVKVTFVFYNFQYLNSLKKKIRRKSRYDLRLWQKAQS